MIDPKSSKVIISEVKAILPEVYTDLAKPAVQVIGITTGRTVKALLAPIRGMLSGLEMIEKTIGIGLQKRIDKIPEENRKTPEPEIAVPTLEALRYTAQNETLREMYLNLLGNSMDDRKKNIVHPSFVYLIKQMNTLDAKVFEKISNGKGYQKIMNPRISLKGKNKFIQEATPEWYAGWKIEGYNEFNISVSFVRLNKFGLIEFMHDKTVWNENYDIIENSEFLKNQLDLTQKKNPNIELEIKGTKSIFYVNEFGKDFRSACK